MSFTKLPIVREFGTYYKKSLEPVTELRLSQLPKEVRKEWKKRENELHPSSFPYCGLRHGYTVLTRDEDPLIFNSFGDDYFLNVGTVAHGVLQKWLGNQRRIVGNWKCLKCEHTHKFKVHPIKCRKCGSDKVEFREVGGAWGRNVRWSKDGIYKRKNKELWVVDYKTSSTYKIDAHNKSGKIFPVVANRFQVENYVVLVEDEFNAPVAGWILCYVSRDYPMFKYAVVAQRMDKDRKDEVRARLKHSDRMFTLALNPDATNMKVLVKNKLCDDKDFYRDNVHNEYDPCPLHKVCFKRQKLIGKVTVALNSGD